MERTLIILKPETLERAIVGTVLQHFDRDDFTSIGMRQRKGSEYMFHEHYNHLDDNVRTAVAQRMSRGDCIFVVYQGIDVIAKVRNIIGTTDPKTAAAGTIRQKYGTAIEYNVVHASDTKESAENEIRLWFPELAPRKSYDDIDYPPFNISYTGC